MREKKAFSDETRKRMSESAKRRCTPEWRKAMSDHSSTPLCKEIVETLYNNGNTQDEIAKILGVTQKVIWAFMRRNGIKARRAAKRYQCGAQNHAWKGDMAKYQAFHLRLSQKWGKASEHGCSVCGTHDPSKCYDWANLTGDYANENDYAPMCRSCHRQYDKGRRNLLKEVV
jgi:DNA-binding CsgD family transcriptional regulator